MQKHDYHDYFLPILNRLYSQRENKDYIDITDCLKGTPEQNDDVYKNLGNAEFANINDPLFYDAGTCKYFKKYKAKILPKGIIYAENFLEE